MTIESTLDHPRRLAVRGVHRPFRRAFGRTLTRIYDALLATPPGRWQHRRLMRGLEFTVRDVRLARATAGLDGLSVAWLSDLHSGLFMTADDLVAIAQRVAASQPDLVCLGGDLINTHFHQMDLLERALELLRPPLGVYAVPGNHEYYYLRDIDGWRAYLEERGVRVLLNRGTRVERGGATLWLCGVDELEEGTPDVAQALEGRREGEPALLLSHHPDVFPEASRRGIDLQLSGHTHGGQVRFFGWAPVTHTIHGYRAGLFRRETAQLYVGSGAGVTFLPIRIGTRSEVPFLRLRVGSA
jgi:hypothetical protein